MVGFSGRRFLKSSLNSTVVPFFTTTPQGEPLLYLGELSCSSLSLHQHPVLCPSSRCGERLRDGCSLRFVLVSLPGDAFAGGPDQDCTIQVFDWSFTSQADASFLFVHSTLSADFLFQLFVLQSVSLEDAGRWQDQAPCCLCLDGTSDVHHRPVQLVWWTRCQWSGCDLKRLSLMGEVACGPMIQQPSVCLWVNYS